jgi:hypothetical protein
MTDDSADSLSNQHLFVCPITIYINVYALGWGIYLDARERIDADEMAMGMGGIQICDAIDGRLIVPIGVEIGYAVGNPSMQTLEGVDVGIADVGFGA